MSLESSSTDCWRFKVAYLGGAYCGWQAQPGLSTVEQTLSTALEELVLKPVSLTAAGRTDSGVHAKAQVVSCTFESRFDENKVLLALASKLPDDISVWQAKKVPANFSAKRHSVGKQYVYRIHQGVVKDPFLAKTHWHLRQQLSLEKMCEAASFLVGEHDYESFRSSQCSAEHARRYLWKVSVRKTLDQTVEFDIRGNAFCHNMVRIIVGTLVDVGLGRISAKSVGQILQQKDREQAGRTAPAHGLTLENVYYPDDLETAEIPKGACFPRYPVTKETWFDKF